MKKVMRTKEVVSYKGKRFMFYLREIDESTGYFGQLEWSAESYATRAEAATAGRIALKAAKQAK
jgi:hypothetical protein